MSINVTTSGPVCTILIDRPETKNAVDGPTAALLAEAFRDFEADEALKVAILGGTNGTFCSGADLKAGASLDETKMVRLEPTGDGPMGPSRMVLRTAPRPSHRTSAPRDGAPARGGSAR